MDFSTDYTSYATDIAELFRATFEASEGAEEGALIGELARRLMTETSADDLRVFIALQDSVPVASIMFSRLSYEGDMRTVFMMAPVAVATGWQGRGIGQKLIRHGVDALRNEGVDIAVTYGDPNFYGQVGFAPVTENDVPAPHVLQHPHGWLAQSLTKAPIMPLTGPAYCVDAFNDPDLW